MENEEGIIVGSKEKPCLVCGKPTKYIDIFSEAHFCSKECFDKFYEEWGGKFKEYVDGVKDGIYIN